MPAFFRRASARAERSVRNAAPRTDVEIKQLLKLLPKYRVLLHNDDVNSMDLVVYALLRSVPSLSPDEAMQIMLEAHTHGTGQVIICLKETAEHYRDLLEGFGLTSTIEPV